MYVVDNTLRGQVAQLWQRDRAKRFRSTCVRGHPQGRNHVFKVGGPIPWSRALLPFYRKNRQVYPVWCSRLHNHTLFITLTLTVGGPSKFGGLDPWPPVVAPTATPCAWPLSYVQWVASHRRAFAHMSLVSCINGLRTYKCQCYRTANTTLQQFTV